MMILRSCSALDRERSRILSVSPLFLNQLDQMNFEEEVEAGLEDMGLLGTGIWKWGWCSDKKVEKKLQMQSGCRHSGSSLSILNSVHAPESDDFEPDYEETDIEHPGLKLAIFAPY